MRSRIVVLARDFDLRARVARLLVRAGHRVEIAESATHASRLDLRGTALAIVSTDALAPGERTPPGWLEGVADKTLLVAGPSGTIVPGAEVFDPSNEEKLLARVADVLRPAPEKAEAAVVLQFAGYRLDLGAYSLSDEAGKEIPLTRSEFSLLQALVQRPGRVLSRDQLLNALSGRDAEAYDRSIDMLMVRLRRKIEPNPKQPSLLVTVPGRGYKFAAKVQAGTTVAASEQPAAVPPGSVPSAPERRYVTGLITELVSVNVGGLPRDPEELGIIIDAYRRYATSIINHQGGKITQYHVRDILAYFGYPIAQEDAAERAIHAGLALIEQLGDGDRPIPSGLSIRVGIASGLVVADPIGEVLGETPSEAARLRDFAEPGQVIVAASTRRLASGLFVYHDLDRLSANGDATLANAGRVVSPSTLISHSAALYADALTPLVDRREERSLLLQAWEDAKSGEGRLILLTGEPGIGKSRLLAALEHELATDPHISLRYFCSTLHRDTPLHPVVARWEREAGFARHDTAEQKLRKLESIIESAALSAMDVALIAGMLGIPTDERYPTPDLSPQRRKERTYAALFQRLTHMTRKHPALVLFEDAQWADPSSLEWLDELIDRLTERPILLVISFRPEFAAPWIGRPGASLIALSRLNRRHAATLVAQVTAQQLLTPAILERIVTQTDGVPLFIEELTKAVLEAALSSDRTAVPLAVPATLQASLMARLDRLPGAKQLAQIGAVIGREFPHELLVAVADLPEAQLTQGLDELLTSGLASRRGVPPEAVYAFKHALVQDAAYESLLRGRRAKIHASIVAAVERDASLAPGPGVLGHHCAQAGLIAKAAAYYRIAGEWSAERAASIETRMQLERGLEFAGSLPDSPDRDRLEAELLLALGNSLQRSKGSADAEAGEIFARAIPICRRLGAPEPLARALWGRCQFVAHQGDGATAEAIGLELLDLAETCHDARVKLAARTALGTRLFLQGHLVGALEHLETATALIAQRQEEAVDPAASSDWRVESLACVYPVLTLACLGYPEQAASRIALILDHPGKAASYRLAVTLGAVVRALIVLRNDHGLRERVMMQAALCEEQGYDYFGAMNRCALGWLEVREGRNEQGLDLLSDGLASLRELEGSLIHLPLFRGMEAEALARDGRRSEALTALGEALEISRATGETWFESELHRLRGELLLTDPESGPRAAEEELWRAIEIARDQAAKLFELRAATKLARLWANEGKRGEARNLLAPVHAWFTEGFDTADLRDARSLLDDLSGR